MSIRRKGPVPIPNLPRILAIAAGLLLTVEAGAMAQEQAPGVRPVRPDDLEWNAGRAGYAAAEFAAVLGAPRESGPFVFRMRMPSGWAMPPHVHDTAEHVTVLSGTLEMSFARGEERFVLPPGSFVSVPAGTPMRAWTGGEPVVIQVHGVGPFRTTPVEPDR